MRSTTSRRSQPDRRLGVRRDDYLVRRRHELLERVPDDIDGVGVDDEAVGGDAVRAQQIERPVEPAPRGRAPRVLVDDVAVTRR